MNLPLKAAIVLLPNQLRLGPLRWSMEGVFAATGLILALWLSLRTARRVGLRPEAVWDAGLFGVMAAFVLSRLLLIGDDPHAFLRLPLVLLMLPSFTGSGMVLTALAVVAYLRWKGVRLLPVMDAWAPCAALLAAMLSLGGFFGGVRPGMPESLPRGGAAGGVTRLYPVQLYAAAAAVVLLVVLIAMLERRLRSGVVAGVALVAGGAVSFLLDMLTQPAEIAGSAWLDPVQWIALGAMLAGAFLLTFVKELN